MLINIDTDSLTTAGAKGVIALIHALFPSLGLFQHVEERGPDDFTIELSPSTAPVPAFPPIAGLPVGAVPLASAPSTAVAAASPTAPGAPLAGVPMPPAAPQPPAATAPTLPAPSAPVAPPHPAGVVEVDSTNLPWDARIHSLAGDGTKPKREDGSWRQKRGVNKGSIVIVEAELRAMGFPAHTASTPIAAPLVPPPPPVAPPASMPAAPLPPAAAAAPVAVQPPVPSGVTADPSTLVQLMPRITSAVRDGTLPTDALRLAVEHLGLANIPALAANPDMVPFVWAHLRENHPAFLAANPYV